MVGGACGFEGDINTLHHVSRGVASELVVMLPYSKSRSWWDRRGSVTLSERHGSESVDSHRAWNEFFLFFK